MSKGYNKFYDRLMKYIISRNLRSFFLFFGLYCLPYFPIRNEMIDGDLNTSIFDFPVLTIRGIVNWEFQFDRRESDDRRFVRYGVQLYEKYGLPIYSVVVDFKAKRDSIKIINIGGKSRFTIYVKSLMAKKADKILNRIKYKIENKIRLTGIDIVSLEVLPLLDLKRKKELLDESIEILLSLNEDLVTLKKIKEIRDVLMFYSRHWEYDENLIKIGGCSQMHDDLYEDTMYYYGKLTREEGRKEGREEGKGELSLEIANDLINDGFSAEDVSKYSHLDLSIVNQLMLMKQFVY